jgi:hypothetical protein
MAGVGQIVSFGLRRFWVTDRDQGSSFSGIRVRRLASLACFAATCVSHMEYHKMNLSPRLLRTVAIQLSAAFCLAWLAPSRASAQLSACDLNLNGSTNVADVQLGVNMVLGVTPCTANITQPGVCNVVVVQRVVNAALGGPCVTDIVPSSHTVTLSWSASTSSGVVGHNVYRGTTAGGPYTKLNSSLVATTNYTDNTVQNGVTYFYVVTAVNSSSAESGFSNMATAVVPTS